MHTFSEYVNKRGSNYIVSEECQTIFIFLFHCRQKCLSQFLYKKLKQAVADGSNIIPHFLFFANGQKNMRPFSYAEKDKNMITNYIKRQKIHHKGKDFIDEYKSLLRENGVEFEENNIMRDLLSS